MQKIIFIKMIILLLLPAFVLSDITVNILGGKDPKINVFGSNTNIINDAERATFNMNDNELKNAVDKYFGSRPEDVFVRSPTPWDDLYKRYNWTEVRRTVVAKSAIVKSYETLLTVIASKSIYNDGPKPTSYIANVSQSEVNTVLHFWTSFGNITIENKIDYNIDVGDGTKFNCNNTFGEENVNKVKTIVGLKTHKNVTLQPKQTAVAVLTASKDTMKVEVEYEVSLNGSLAINYDWTHKGHHFWAMEVNTVLEAGGIPKIVTWKEMITAIFYSEESMFVYDVNGESLI